MTQTLWKYPSPQVRFMLALLSAALLINLASAGQRRELLPGDPAPSFSTHDQYGRTVALPDLLREGKAVLLFYRGYWCPYCNKALKNFQDSLSLITEKKARVIAISPEKPEYQQKTMDITKAAFSLISDQRHQIMDTYGVTFSLDSMAVMRLKNAGIRLGEINGNNGTVLPVPAVFIIEQSGIISYRFFDPNYRNRPSVAAILEQLQSEQ